MTNIDDELHALYVLNGEIDNKIEACGRAIDAIDDMLRELDGELSDIDTFPITVVMNRLYDQSKEVGQQITNARARKEEDLVYDLGADPIDIYG